MARVFLIGTAALLVSLVGCGDNERRRAENALRQNPPVETRTPSVKCDEYEGERFRESQVFHCEFGDSSTIWDGCVAVVGESLFFATGKGDCLEGGFSRVGSIQ